MCVDSVCDCVECVIGLWLDVLPVCVFYLYVVRMRVGSSDMSLGGESDKKCGAAKPRKLTVEVLPRPPYNDRTKTLGAVGRDVRRESKQERRRDECGDSHGSCRWSTWRVVVDHETSRESVPLERL